MKITNLFDEPMVARLVLTRGYGPMGSTLKVPCRCGRTSIAALAEREGPWRPMCINCIILMLKTGGREIQVKE